MSEWMDTITNSLETLLEVCTDEGREFTHKQADKLRKIISENEQIHSPEHC